jgi:hypothetical protein
MDKMLLIEESGLSFSIQTPSPAIQEETKTGYYILKGVPASIIDEVNGNGRKYSVNEIKKSISKARKEGAFASRKLLCSANDHPTESYVPPASASHVILDAYTRKTKEPQEEGVPGKGGKERTFLMNDWLILDTHSGKDLKALVDAGASFGTSIRGLGQLNEDTKEVHNYDFLGCDAVGNPSAGTYASKGQFRVTVESAPRTLINKVQEILEDKEMSASNGGFNLQDRISEFKTKHFVGNYPPSQVTQQITSDLLSIQREAVEEGLDTSDIEELSDQLFGTPSVVVPKAKIQKENSNGDLDLINRTKRELEATQNLAVDLKSKVAELTDLRGDTLKEVKAYENVAVAYENVAVQLYDLIEENAQEHELSKTNEKLLTARKAMTTIRGLQKEAFSVIKNLETRLESAIRVGDSAIDTAITLRRIADSLYSRQMEQMESAESFKHSRTKTHQIENKTTQSAMTESQKKNRVSPTGNRSGWY